MKLSKRILLATSMILSTGAIASAQIPTNTVIIGDNAYDINYVGSNEEIKSEVKQALNNDMTNDIFYKLSDESIVDFETFENFNFAQNKEVKYYDAYGNMTYENILDELKLEYVESISADSVILSFNTKVSSGEHVFLEQFPSDKFDIRLSQIVDNKKKYFKIKGFKSIEGNQKGLEMILDTDVEDNYLIDNSSFEVEFENKLTGAIECKSNYVTDSRKIEFLKAKAIDNKTIELEFTEPVFYTYDSNNKNYELSATNINNYLINGVEMGTGSITIGKIDSYTQEDKRNIVTIHLDNKLTEGQNIIEIKNIADFAGASDEYNRVTSQSLLFDVQKDFVVEFAYAYKNISNGLSADTVDKGNNNDAIYIKFNDEIDLIKAINPDNYVFNGTRLPNGTTITANINGFDELDESVDSLTIELPDGEIVDGSIIMINAYSNDGFNITTGELKFPYVDENYNGELPYENLNDDISFSWEAQSPEQFIINFDKNIDLTNAKYTIEAKGMGDLRLSSDNNDFDINVLNEGSEYLVELNKDWTKILDTQSTMYNYFNYDLTLVIEVDGNIYKSNMIKLSPDWNSPDFDVEVLTSVNNLNECYAGSDDIESYLNLSDAGAVYVNFTEPVQMLQNNNGIKEVINTTPNGVDGQILTPSQQQWDDIPISDISYIKIEDEFGKTIENGQEVDGYMMNTSELEGNYSKKDMSVIINPKEALSEGKWNLIIRNITDDIGNSSVTKVTEITIKNN
ncbi:hypothetical protein WG909_07370 [Peptostreptococcaceae bacterium AGR-M142]